MKKGRIMDQFLRDIGANIKGKPCSLLSDGDIPYSIVESELEEFLQQELLGLPAPQPQSLPACDASTKWKFSSALQKSIRRGYADDALRYALVFHSIDPVAFWTRLVVIAFEDIGIGGVWEVALTLVAARSKVFRRRLGGDVKVIHYLIRILCLSAKDRSCCDLMISLWHTERKPAVFNALKKASFEALSSIALSNTQSTSLRASAAWLLWGTDKLENKELPQRAGAKEVFMSTIEKMEVPALVKYVAIRGMTACRYPMNLVYPFLWWQVHRSAYRGIENTPCTADRFYIGGLPEECYDQHVREGRSSLAYFSKTCVSVDRWLTTKGITSSDAKLAAVGAAVFIVEGAKLDKRLVFEGSNEIYESAEKFDYQNVGLSLEEGRGLAQLIKEHWKEIRLARIRVVENAKLPRHAD